MHHRIPLLLLGGLLALIGRNAAAESPIADCSVTRPDGRYAMVTLQFSVPGAAEIAEQYAQWTCIGGMRDGRMAIGHGIGLRRPGGTLRLQGDKLTGTFRHSRKTRKRWGPVMTVTVEATVVDGKCTGKATIDGHVGKVTGTITSADELARANPIPDGVGWPSFLGPAGSGATAEATGVELVGSENGIDLVWGPEETDIGQGIGSISRYMHKWKDAGARRTCSGSASPVAADGRIYLSYYVPSPVQAPDDKALQEMAAEAGLAAENLPEYALEKIYPRVDDIVLCMDAQTGQTIWKARMAGRGLNHQHHKEGPFNMTPGLGGGRIFAIGMSNHLYALDAATGRPLWEAPLNNSRRRSLFSATALVGRNVVVVPRQGRWAGFDPASGKLLWQSEIRQQHVTLAFYSAGQKDYFIGGSDGKIVCLDGADGKIVWTLDGKVLSHGRGLGSGGISIHGDTLLTYLQEGGKKDWKPFCAAWRLDGGSKPKQLWRISVEGSNAEHVPVVVRGKYVFTGDLACTDLATGRRLDQTEGVKPGNGGYMQAMEDTVLVRRDGTHGQIEIALYRIGPDGKITTLTPPGQSWRPPYGGATTSYHHALMYPLLAGRIYLRQADGVYCWDMRKR
jgi:outer membrane protein assembly factor BamB